MSLRFASPLVLALIAWPPHAAVAQNQNETIETVDCGKITSDQRAEYLKCMAGLEASANKVSVEVLSINVRPKKDAYDFPRVLARVRLLGSERRNFPKEFTLVSRKFGEWHATLAGGKGEISGENGWQVSANTVFNAAIGRDVLSATIASVRGLTNTYEITEFVSVGAKLYDLERRGER